MFTHYIQYGGDPYDKYEYRGPTDLDHFMGVFDNFPWMEEIARANATPGGSSPTLSVKNTTSHNELWVSMSGNHHSHGYLVGYIYPTTRKRLLGLGKAKEIRWQEIYLTRDMQSVRHYFKLYFANEYDLLQSALGQLQRFTALEVPN